MVTQLELFSTLGSLVPLNTYKIQKYPEVPLSTLKSPEVP